MKKSAHVTAMFVFLVITFSAFSQTTKTLILRPGPTDGIDADIRTDMPQTPRGSSPDFIANAWTAQGNYFVQRSLLKFDLSQIPADAKVIRATLFLFTNLTTGHYQLDSGANASLMLRVSEPWSENQVYWDNQPSFSPNSPVIIPQSVTHTQNYELDVTSHVSDMVGNPAGNHGWLFTLQTEEKYRCMVFASSDNTVAAWRPKLVVEYSDCEPPVANFSSAVESPNVKFTDLSTTAASWHWSFGDETTSSEQNPYHQYALPGKYLVCLEISDSCGEASVCDTVEVPCVPTEVLFAWSGSNGTIHFIDTSYSFPPASRLWDFGDGSTSALHNPVHVYAVGGIYDVCLTVTDSCGEDVQCSSLQLSLPLMPQFSSSQDEFNALNITFYDNTQGAKGWLWDFGDGTTSREQNPVHLYSQYGNYTICLTVGDICLRDKICKTIKVTRLNASNNGNSIIFYPNPSSVTGKLSFLIFEDAASATIVITDLAGRTMLTQTFFNVGRNEPVEIDVSRLSKGVYLIEGSFNSYRKTTKLELF
jgi:PKD repeat protein